MLLERVPCDDALVEMEGDPAPYRQRIDEKCAHRRAAKGDGGGH